MQPTARGEVISTSFPRFVSPLLSFVSCPIFQDMFPAHPHEGVIGSLQSLPVNIFLFLKLDQGIDRANESIEFLRIFFAHECDIDNPMAVGGKKPQSCRDNTGSAKH